MLKKQGKKITAKALARSTKNRPQRPAAKKVSKTVTSVAKMAAAKSKAKKTNSQTRPRKGVVKKLLTKTELIRQPQNKYMSTEQLEFFKQLLSRQHRDVNQELANLRRRLTEKQNNHQETDVADQAAQTEELAVIEKMVNREQRLLHKVELALLRIERGEYGYCEVSAKPIGIKRLLLNPTTPYCVEIKEQLEKREQRKLK